MVKQVARTICECVSIPLPFSFACSTRNLSKYSVCFRRYGLVPFRSASWRAGLYFAVGSYYDQASPSGRVYCELLVSSNYGANWTRLAPHQAFIPLGNDTAFDSHTCYASNALLPEQVAQMQPQQRVVFPASAVGIAQIYYAGGDGPHSGSINSGRSNSIGRATFPIHALAGITRHLESPAIENNATTAVVITGPIAIPQRHNSKTTRLWLLLSHSGDNEKFGAQVAETAVRVSLLPGNISIQADTEQAELLGAAMHQSELWPWTNLATEKELSEAEQTAIGVEGLHTVEVRWSGLSFADTWRRADRESSVVRLKIGLQADGIVLSAFGFA